MPTRVRLPKAFIEQARERAKQKAIAALARIGDESVQEAVESGNYNDRTGNLRSSIGYVVSDDGIIVREGGFWSLGTGEGPTMGREKAESVASQTEGLALVLVAGMSYAQYVADRGYNVIDSAEILARRLVSQLG